MGWGKEKLESSSNKNETLSLSLSQTHKEEENAPTPPTPGPNNILLYQRFIVNQLAQAAGVCEGGAPRETMDSPVVLLFNHFC